MEKKQNQSEGMGSDMQNRCASYCRSSFSSLMIAIMILNLIATAGLAYAMYDYKTSGIKAAEASAKTAMLQVEYDRSGGKEIYDLITQVQKLSAPQTKQQIEAAIKQLGGTTAPTTTDGSATTPPSTSSTDLTADQYAAIMKDSYAEGNKSAKITLVEYSDLECPYCIIQYKNKTISKLQEKYGDKVNVIYKPLNLARHPGADQKGMASLCVAQIAGAEKYSKFYNAILDRSNERGPVFPLDNIKALAKEIGGIDATKFAACYDGQKTKSVYESYTAEALARGVEGTPTIMVLNNETKKFELVKGAADVSSFYPVVDRLMK